MPNQRQMTIPARINRVRFYKNNRKKFDYDTHFPTQTLSRLIMLVAKENEFLRLFLIFGGWKSQKNIKSHSINTCKKCP